MALCRTQIVSASVIILVFGFCLDLSFGHEGHQHSGSTCTSEVHECHSRQHHHQCGHGHYPHHHHHHEVEKLISGSKLPEDLAEEEDMKLYGFGLRHDHVHFGTSELSGFGLWLSALGCSVLVSIASFICLITLPIIFVQGKPSKAVVDSLALFGAGDMLGDAFLHQALLWGRDPGQSSLIEGFTAGGFIYIAIGALAEMNNIGNSTLRSTVVQISSLTMGILVALGISLVGC